MLRCFAEVNHLSQLNHNEINFTQVTFFSLVDVFQFMFFFSPTDADQPERKKATDCTQLTGVDSMHFAISNVYTIGPFSRKRSYIRPLFLYGFFSRNIEIKTKA